MRMHLTHAYDRTAAARDLRQPATIGRDLERQQRTADGDPVCRCARTATARSSSSALLFCVLLTDSATSGTVTTPECRRRHRDRAYTALWRTPSECATRSFVCGCSASPAVTIRGSGGRCARRPSLGRTASAHCEARQLPGRRRQAEAQPSLLPFDYRGIDRPGWVGYVVPDGCGESLRGCVRALDIDLGD